MVQAGRSGGAFRLAGHARRSGGPVPGWRRGAGKSLDGRRPGTVPQDRANGRASAPGTARIRLMRPFTSTITLDEARARLLAAVVPVDRQETVTLAGAHGRVLAQDVTAPFDVPLFDRS